MGLFDTIRADIVCPRCSYYGEVEIQTKDFSPYQRDYAVGDAPLPPGSIVKMQFWEMAVCPQCSESYGPHDYQKADLPVLITYEDWKIALVEARPDEEYDRWLQKATAIEESVFDYERQRAEVAQSWKEYAEQAAAEEEIAVEDEIE